MTARPASRPQDPPLTTQSLDPISPDPMLPVAGASSPLTIHPAALGDPAVVDLVWRSALLGSGDLDGAPASGDHALNPGLAPGNGRTPRAAAVLMAMAMDTDGRLSVVFTQRAKHLAAHPGQIALPGGKIEPGETATEAALREAFEEVGLQPSSVTLLGAADRYLTRTGFVVTPVLGLVHRDAELTADPAEVASVFTAPFQHVMSPSNHREVEVLDGDQPRTFYEIPYGERRIWGATAGILRLVQGKLYGPCSA